MLLENFSELNENENLEEEAKLTLLKYIYGMLLKDVHVDLLADLKGSDKKEAIEGFQFFEEEYKMPEPDLRQ